MTSEQEENPLVTYARAELQRAGLFDKDADYGGDLGGAVMELVEVLAKQGHSGMSHTMVMHIFGEVANFRPITPITNDPDEWQQITDGLVADGEPPMWQSRRNPTLFSHDGGKTYYDLDERQDDWDNPVFHESKEHTSA